MLTACDHPRTSGLKERQARGLCRLMIIMISLFLHWSGSIEERSETNNGNAFDSMRYILVGTPLYLGNYSYM